MATRNLVVLYKGCDNKLTYYITLDHFMSYVCQSHLQGLLYS